MNKDLFRRANIYIRTHGARVSFTLPDLRREMQRQLDQLQPTHIVR
jgi:hypothetical protein